MTSEYNIKEYLNNIIHEDFKLSQNSLAFSLNLKSKKRPTKKKQVDTVQPKGKKLTAVEKKVLYYIPRKYITFEEGQLMHKEWLVYFRDLVDTKKLTAGEGPLLNEHLRSTIQRMCMSGAHVKVVQSTNQSLIGIEGIILIDTINTFKIVDTKNLVKTIPKKNSLFEFKADKFVFNIYGAHLCSRPVDRMAKKTKMLKLIDYAAINRSKA